MSELTLIVLRFGFVVALWLFVIVALLVLRNDLFGTTVITRGGSGRKAGAERRTVSDPSALQQGQKTTDPNAV